MALKYEIFTAQYYSCIHAYQVGRLLLSHSVFTQLISSAAIKSRLLPQVWRLSSDPYLLVRCGLVLSAQQVNLFPHSLSAIRDGGETRIPSPQPQSCSFLAHWPLRLDWSGKVIPYHPHLRSRVTKKRKKKTATDVTSQSKTSLLPPRLLQCQRRSTESSAPPLLFCAESY